MNAKAGNISVLLPIRNGVSSLKRSVSIAAKQVAPIAFIKMNLNPLLNDIFNRLKIELLILDITLLTMRTS